MTKSDSIQENIPTPLIEKADIAIRVERLSKVYRLYPSHRDRLKEALHPLRKKYHHDFYALQDVSFEVYKGETVGIIGQNGSGKSTLLSIIAGVLQPSAGSVFVNGRVSSLLELGAGFNPELTGVENIYFYGMIAGFTREEMDDKMSAIVSFADIGEFIYQPVKIYSSGMFVRLAFACATAIEPDVLIVDEALSVGDMKFQKKCMEKIDSIRSMGATILFCTHDMHAVSSLCKRAIWMDKGTVRSSGDRNNIISEYISQDTQVSDVKIFIDKTKNPNHFIKKSEIAEILEVQTYNSAQEECSVFLSGDDIYVEARYLINSEISNPQYSVIIFRDDRIPCLIGKTLYEEYFSMGVKTGLVCVKFVIKACPLNSGKYTIGFSVWDKSNSISFANNIVKEFIIKSTKIVFGPTEESAVFFGDVNWNYP